MRMVYKSGTRPGKRTEIDGVTQWAKWCARPDDAAAGLYALIRTANISEGRERESGEERRGKGRRPLHLLLTVETAIPPIKSASVPSVQQRASGDSDGTKHTERKTLTPRAQTIHRHWTNRFPTALASPRTPRCQRGISTFANIYADTLASFKIHFSACSSREPLAMHFWSTITKFRSNSDRAVRWWRRSPHSLARAPS